MSYLKEDSLKKLYMFMIYRDDDENIFMKEYSSWKDLDSVFNTIPSNNLLSKSIKTFFLADISLKPNYIVNILPSNYSKENIKTYFDFLKMSFSVLKKKKDNDLLLYQKRYIKGRGKTVIIVSSKSNIPYSKEYLYNLNV